MFAKVLIACALVVAVQASGYGSKTELAGYEAKPYPRATLQVLPSYYHAAPLYGAGYSAGPAYGAGLAYGDAYGHLSSHNPAIRHIANNHIAADSLARLALSLPSAGAPNPALLYVPKHSITTYSAPAAVLSYDGKGGLLSSQTAAAAAASSVKSARSGYGPAQARLDYGYGAAY